MLRNNKKKGVIRGIKDMKMYGSIERMCLVYIKNSENAGEYKMYEMLYVPMVFGG